MQVKNIVRKAVVLGSAAGFVGMTIAGALAYDLSTYPAKFIVDGKFDGKIVVGEKASTSDVLGSIDIAASLQGASVSKVAIPGTAGSTGLSGDVFQIGGPTSSSKLELRKSIGNVTDTITENDLTGLKGGSITTSEGTTEFHQYLRLKDGAALQNMAVNFAQNDNDKTADFLVVAANKPFLEWEVQFPDGLESKMATSPATELKDIQDRTFNIMGTDFNIVKADHLKGTTSASLTLMGGSVPDTLREGETKTYTINGVDYEVTLVFVSDPSSSASGGTQVKFSVNGEITQALSAGDTDTLSGGLQIGVRDILVNAREGVASFFLGADKVVITDGDVSNTAFDGTVEINNKNMQDGQADIQGAESGNNFKITSIKYEVAMDSTSGATAYVEAGHGVREFMKRPQTLISDSLDLQYTGLTTPVTKDFALKASSDNRYRLSFTNTLGQSYDVPFFDNKAAPKFGDDNHNFIFTEGVTITRNDYFAVTFSGVDADRAPTNVLRYTGFDTTTLTASFEDVAGGSTVTVPVVNTTGNVGNGNMVIGGHTYLTTVADDTVKDSTITVDLDGSGAVGTNAVGLVTWGGGIISLGNNTAQANVAVDPRLNMSYTMLARNFGTSGNGNEVLQWTVDQVASNKVSLTVGGYRGPLAGGDSENEFAMNAKTSGSDYDLGMTDFGTVISHYHPSSGNNADELTLSIPQQQTLAQVYVSLGKTTSVSGGSGGTADHVNPIAVGIAVLDKDAPAIGSDNLIVVGGPCANTVAATLMGNPAVCGEGFEAGKAMIKSWEKTGKVAILVAGYESTETLGASRVLAAYKDYALKGDAVEVVVADLNSIKVQAPTVMAPATNTTA